MTRETKIGLLVGLAFIIVIGILLSDHLTSSTEPPAAPISGAGAVVRSAVNTPAQTQQPVAQLTAPPVQLNQPVRTADEFQPRPQPVKMVSIDTPAPQEPVTITSPNTDPGATNPQQAGQLNSGGPAAMAQDSAAQQDQLAQRPPQAGTVGSQVNTPIRSNDPIVARMNAEAQRLGEAIVPLDTSRPQQPAAMSKYKVEPGDSLSMIANKVYGTSNKAVIAAIIDANPSLKANPDLVIEGRTYNMPAISSNKPVALAAEPVAQAVPAQAKSQSSQWTSQMDSSSRPGPSATYVVEEGDNLTRIAREQCGTEDAVAAIKELNRDILKGGDVIRPGMKLKLPAKGLAVNQ